MDRISRRSPSRVRGDRVIGRRCCLAESSFSSEFNKARVIPLISTHSRRRLFTPKTAAAPTTKSPKDYSKGLGFVKELSGLLEQRHGRPGTFAPEPEKRRIGFGQRLDVGRVESFLAQVQGLVRRLG